MYITLYFGGGVPGFLTLRRRQLSVYILHQRTSEDCDIGNHSTGLLNIFLYSMLVLYKSFNTRLYITYIYTNISRVAGFSYIVAKFLVLDWGI